MDKLTHTKALLDNISLSEGSDFVFDENAILNEYQKLGENKSSLAIKILSILGGFLATLTFLGFLAIAGLYESEFALLILGIVFISSAIWLNKKYDKLIIDTFSISIYVIGFVLFSYGSFQFINENIIIVLVGFIALLSLFITQNYILSFISVLTVSASLLTLIIYNDFYNLIHLHIALNTLFLTFIFLNEAKIISYNRKLSKLYNPLRIALVFSLLLELLIVGQRHLSPISINYIWISSIVMIFSTMYLVYLITKINKIESNKNKVLIYLLSCLILIPTIYSPSISGALLIVLLSFLVNYKTGLVIGVISLIYFISQYYYDLNFTLLNKSIILISSGVIFLLFYLFTSKKLNSNEKI